MTAPRTVQRRYASWMRPAPANPFISRFVYFIGGLAIVLGAISYAGKAHGAELDANGNGAARVRSKSGVTVRVNPSARAALQCVVNYVENAGVKIKFMRGYGAGTVRGSMHPGGRALDINQTARDVTRPRVPRSVSNAAADNCGVISGARWGYADNGHWNLTQFGRPREPWPRVLRTEAVPQ